MKNWIVPATLVITTLIVVSVFVVNSFVVRAQDSSVKVNTNQQSATCSSGNCNGG